MPLEDEKVLQVEASCSGLGGSTSSIQPTHDDCSSEGVVRDAIMSGEQALMQAALQLLVRSNLSASEVARRYGVPARTLRRRFNQLHEAGITRTSAVSGGGSTSLPTSGQWRCGPTASVTVPASAGDSPLVQVPLAGSFPAHWGHYVPAMTQARHAQAYLAGGVATGPRMARPRVVAEDEAPLGLQADASGIAEVFQSYINGALLCLSWIRVREQDEAPADLRGRERDGMGCDALCCHGGVWQAGRLLRVEDGNTAVGVTVDSGGQGFVEMVTCRPNPPAVGGLGLGHLRLHANAEPDMQASLEAAFLWLRMNVRGVCTSILGPGQGSVRLEQLEREGVPVLTVSVAPLYDKGQGSMGIAFACAMASAIVQWPLRTDLAFTGEVDVRGRLVPVAGVQDKARALGAVGINTLVVAAGSLDKDELSALQASFGHVVECQDMWQVLGHAFKPPPRSVHGPSLPDAQPHEGDGTQQQEHEAGAMAVPPLGRGLVGCVRCLDRHRTTYGSLGGLRIDVPYLPSVQCVVAVEREGTGAAPNESLPWRVTGLASRLVTDVVGVAHCLVLDGVRQGAWGQLQLPWPLPVGVGAHVIYHVSPSLVPGWADQRHYMLAMALSLLSALCGRRCVAGLVAVGEINRGGQLLPIRGVDGDLLGWLEKTVGRERGPTMLLTSVEAALKFKHAVSREGSQQLRRRLEVVGVDNFSQAVQVAFAQDRVG